MLKSEIEQKKNDEKQLFFFLALCTCLHFVVSGTTWSTFILHHILNDADLDKVSRKGHISSQMSYIEWVSPGETPHVDVLMSQQPPRVYKTHLPYKYMKKAIEEDKTKVILVLRNPKDTLVSFYHFYKMCNLYGNFPGNFNDFFEMIKAKKIAFGDFFEWTSEWWQCSNLDHVLVLRYEDMIKDPLTIVTKLSKFVGKELSDEQIQTVVNECAMKKMEKNPVTNVDDWTFFDQSISKFYRKGKVGDWVNHFTEEQSQMFDDKSKEYFDPIGLTFDYE